MCPKVTVSCAHSLGWICINVICWVLLTGCASVHYYEHNVESYDEINQKTKAKNVEIRLASGQIKKGHSLKTSVDTTRWIESLTLSTSGVSTSEVSEIHIKNQKRGAVEGFCVFAAIGAAAGVLLGSFGEAMDDIPGENQGYRLKYGLVGGIFTGTVLGVPIGMAVGSKDKFILHVSID